MFGSDSVDASRQARHVMVEKLRSMGIRNEETLEAMGKTPRHRFVPSKEYYRAYGDHPVGIGAGQTISQPYMVAAMMENLTPQSHETALEVGSGCGYAAAVLARLSAKVYAVEKIQSLAANAKQILGDLGILNVEVFCGDGSMGWPANAPYDLILLSAAVPKVSEQLLKQLKDGGRLIAPIGSKEEQTLNLFLKIGDGISQRELFPCKFVPIIGPGGFSAI